jgi:hypothetical protein
MTVMQNIHCAAPLQLRLGESRPVEPEISVTGVPLWQASTLPVGGQK